MDTGIDLIQPEFLNILFFQQKNLVIFPYIDLKHLHTLEIYTVGHNVVDLESTALHNIREILEYESTNSYSQNPSFFFIYNINPEKIKEIMTIDNVRCVINTNEKVENPIKEDGFVFYNKKNKSFINYNKDQQDLEFEKELITSSSNEAELQDKIQKIKTEATRIFTEINQKGRLDSLPEILTDYDPKYWNKILDFVKLYFKIELPKSDKILNTPKKIKVQERILRSSSLKDFTNEYERIISQNKNIAKEFIQLLHDYRSRHVNASNLDLEQLYNPQKLYIYLRNHHWNPQISEDFLINWIKMENTHLKLTENDINDFEEIFRFLNIPDDFLSEKITQIFYNEEKVDKNQLSVKEKAKVRKKNEISSINSFDEFKKITIKKIRLIEKLIEVDELERKALFLFNHKMYGDYIHKKITAAEILAETLYFKLMDLEYPNKDIKERINRIIEAIEKELKINFHLNSALHKWQKVRNEAAHGTIKVDEREIEEANHFFIKFKKEIISYL